MARTTPIRHRNARLLLLTAALLTSGCSQQSLFDSPVVEQPKIAQVTQSTRRLESLPPAKMPIAVSVYDFQDQTGQLKPNNTFAEYSRAVTQGGHAILNKALLNAANGSFFTVVERGGLKNLLQERQIINVMRTEYGVADGEAAGKLPPLLYAGMLIEGGIVGYDSNIVTGGLGANYLGIGGNTNHQRDIVTVDLRAVNISNGQVLLSVTSEKTIYSTGVAGNVFKYVSLNHLLEAETGFTVNEPPQLAVRQAIETAVYQLIMEGARRNLWEFADPNAGQAVLADYEQRLQKATAQADFVGPVEEQNPVEPAVPARSTPLMSTQLPATAEASANNTLKPQAEKKSIIDSIKEFLGDEPTGHDPMQYPPIPLPPQRR
jgi:curli production assembly/transport component CsgG